MKVIIKKLPKSQIELEIEVPAEEFNGFINRATLNLSKNLEVKGFRKGKVPKEVVEKQAGKEKILVEAGHLAVEENYRKAILENKVEAISQPEINIKKLAPGNSFVFLAKIEVLPEIKLPDYKKIAAKIKKKKIEVEKKEIDDALKWLQKSRAKFTLKNGAAEKGDFVEIEYWLPQINAEKEGSPQKDAFILGEGHFISGFEEQLIGMKTGPASAPDGATAGKEEKEFSLTIPEKHPLRKYGEKITFKIKMNSVQNVELPEINDQFAQSLGNFENLTALRENIKKGLNLEKERAESQRIRKEILEKLSQATECEPPEILAEQEKKRMLENFKREVSEKLKTSFTDYLTRIKKTKKEILDSFLPQAQKKVKNFLILKEIGKREKVEVSEAEIMEEMNKILKQYPNIKETQEKLDSERLKEYTRETLRTEKIFQLLENFSSHNI